MTEGDKRPKTRRAKAFNQPRKPASPRRIPPEKKKSPNCLRRVFTAIRNTAGHDGTYLAHPEFLELLTKKWAEARQADNGRYGIKKLTQQVFRATERGTTPLSYWHLESYAHAIGVPSAVFLVISRLTARKRHVRDPGGIPTSETVDPKHVISGIRALLDEFENGLIDKDPIDDSDILFLIEAYKKGLTNSSAK